MITEPLCTESVPPSLIRRSPARIEMVIGDDQAPTMTGRVIHLRGGDRLRIKVVPQNTAEEPPARVSVESASCLQATVPLAYSNEAGRQVWHVEYKTKYRPVLKALPLPRRATIHVTSTVLGLEPYPIEIDVVIWPSAGLVLGIVLFGVVLSAAFNRYELLIRSRDPFDAIAHLAQDTAFWGQSLWLAGLSWLMLRLVNWAAIWTGFAPEDSD